MPKTRSINKKVFYYVAEIKNIDCIHVSYRDEIPIDYKDVIEYKNSHSLNLKGNITYTCSKKAKTDMPVEVQFYAPSTRAISYCTMNNNQLAETDTDHKKCIHFVSFIPLEVLNSIMQICLNYKDKLYFCFRGNEFYRNRALMIGWELDTRPDF